ncbi:DUF1707 SHOCT-like domain-containing protein [Nocardioides speluncae]|uniref:DUF1707 SHOCT-like domain-containing protein n=1 Tax=Nocardioides speluncae TaxID=2670337 RepID=UPI00197F4C59|nr:DUF1707 domain-containing protein [Nocardioides speluncae]
MSVPEIWQQFERDPRASEYAGLRASDRDRDVVLQILGEAYADGRLDRAELDERTDAVHRIRTLGELPELVADLVPQSATRAVVAVSGTAFERKIKARYDRERRDALWAFLSASTICWVIWIATGMNGHPWPIWVMLGTGLNIGRVLVKRQDIMESERQRLEKQASRRERRELREQQRRDELPSSQDGDSSKDPETP